MRSSIFGFSIVLLGIASGQPVYSEDRFPSIGSDEFEWGLGVGALVEDEGYRNLGSETNPQPVIYVASQRFRFIANQLEVTLSENDKFAAALKLEARFDGFEADEDDYFSGLEDRDGGIYGGFRTEYRAPFANIVFEGLKSVAGDGEGGYGSVGAFWEIDSAVGVWVPKIAVEYYQQEYTAYYYGVTAAEASADRPAYAPDSAINIDVGVDLIKDFSDHHKVIASMKYRRYDTTIQDSPLIDASGSPRFILGYLYTF